MPRRVRQLDADEGCSGVGLPMPLGPVQSWSKMCDQTSDRARQGRAR